MYALRIVEPPERQLSRALDTTKLWVNSDNCARSHALATSTPLASHGGMCISLFPHGSTEDHSNRLCQLSCLAQFGPYTPCNSGSLEAFTLAQYSCWKRDLPRGLLGEIYRYIKPNYPSETASHNLCSLRVRQLSPFLEDLVTMRI